MKIIETYRYIWLIVPHALIYLVLVCDLDIGMVLPDPVEDFGRFFKGQDDEQMLGLGVRTAAHGEGRSQQGEAA